MKDYYLILKIAPDSTLETIKQAYRKLAKLYHPDKTGHEGSQVNEEQFKEISEAYETLKDPVKRREYDAKRRRRVEEERQGTRGESFGHTGGWGSFHDAFSTPASLSADIILSPEESRQGGAVPIDLPVAVECPECWGFGITFFSTCPRCGGIGNLQRNYRFEIQIPENVRHGQRVRYRLPFYLGFNQVLEFRFLIEE